MSTNQSCNKFIHEIAYKNFNKSNFLTLSETLPTPHSINLTPLQNATAAIPCDSTANKGGVSSV